MTPTTTQKRLFAALLLFWLISIITVFSESTYTLQIRTEFGYIPPYYAGVNAFFSGSVNGVSNVLCNGTSYPPLYQSVDLATTCKNTATYYVFMLEVGITSVLTAFRNTVAANPGCQKFLVLSSMWQTPLVNWNPSSLSYYPVYYTRPNVVTELEVLLFHLVATRGFNSVLYVDDTTPKVPAEYNAFQHYCTKYNISSTTITYSTLSQTIYTNLPVLILVATDLNSAAAPKTVYNFSSLAAMYPQATFGFSLTFLLNTAAGGVTNSDYYFASSLGDGSYTSSTEDVQDIHAQRIGQRDASTLFTAMCRQVIANSSHRVAYDMQSYKWTDEAGNVHRMGPYVRPLSQRTTVDSPCNIGSRTIAIKHHASSSVMNEEAVYPISPCARDGGVGALMMPARVAVLANTSYPTYLSAGCTTRGTVHPCVTVPLSSASGNMTLALYNTWRMTNATALYAGTVLDDALSYASNDTMVIDPVHLWPQLRVASENVLYLSATLDQQMQVVAAHALAKNLMVTLMYSKDFQSTKGAKLSDVFATMLGKNLAETEDNMHKYTCGDKLDGITKYSSCVADLGLVFLAGATSEESVRCVINYVATSSCGTELVIAHDTFVRYFSVINDAVGKNDTLAALVMTANNLQPAPSDPLRRRAQMTGTFIGTVSALSTNAFLAPTFRDAVYGTRYLSIQYTGVNIRGFKRSPLVNYIEDSTVQLWTLLGIRGTPTTSTTTTTVPPTDTTMPPGWTGTSTASPPTTNTTTNPGNSRSDSSSSSTKIIVPVVVVACVVVAAVVVVVVLFCMGCIGGNARDNHNAPKEQGRPVTLIFTDIESSTALWSAVPREMSEAVSRHHRMIRQLIVKYKCYEVKTIGDSFMIACGDAFSAVQLVAELQRVFLECDWGTTAIDETYRMLRRKKKGADAVEDAPGSWSGLRVRVGVHTGVCECRYDDVMKGYDYYGDAVNTAARTESLGCGGQVLLTEGTRSALSSEELAQTPMTALGPQYLRGVAGTLNMYQLDTVGGRVFPQLMTKPPEESEGPAAQGVVEEQGRHKGDVMNILRSAEENEEEPLNAEPAAEVLDVYFSPFSSRQKIRMLGKTCKQLSIEKPPRAAYGSDEAYAQALITILAERTADVIEFRRQLGVSIVSSATNRAQQADDTASMLLVMDNGELLRLGGMEHPVWNPLSSTRL